MKIVLLIVLTMLISNGLWADRLSQGDSELKKGNFDAAISAYQDYLKENKNSYEAGFGWARALSYSGKKKEAIDAYSQLLSLYPGDPDAHLGRGRVYAWMGDFEASEKDLIRVVKKAPDYADAWTALGDMYFWSGNYEKAREAYSKCSELQPEKAGPYLALSKISVAQRKFPQAREELYRAKEKGAPIGEVDQALRAIDRNPSAMKWEGSFSYDYQSFSENRPHAETYTSYVKREFDKGSLILEVTEANRFEEWDSAFALETYLDLWRRSYGNFRFQVTDGVEILPRINYLAEIFQGVGTGWEISASYRFADFFTDSVDTYGASLGRYIGEWYLRGKTSFIPKSGELALVHSFSVRRYLGDVDTFVELGAGIGIEEIYLPGTHDLESRHTHFFTIRVQKLLTPHVGVFAGGDYVDTEKGPVQRGFALGVLTRW